MASRSPKKSRRPVRVPAPAASAWTFLTNHSHVLICLALDPQMRLSEVAQKVHITERAVQRIVADLEAGGILERTRVGRRNQYTINREAALRHALESHRSVADLLRLGERDAAT